MAREELELSSAVFSYISKFLKPPQRPSNFMAKNDSKHKDMA
jgi:hypothetical protein